MQFGAKERVRWTASGNMGLCQCVVFSYSLIYNYLNHISFLRILFQNVSLCTANCYCRFTNCVLVLVLQSTKNKEHFKVVTECLYLDEVAART